METKQIALVGYGAMGQRIAAAIEAREGWELCGAIDPLHTPQRHASLEELPQVPHLIIDFSHLANLAMVCDYVQRHKVPCVIATTGYTPAQRGHVPKSWRPMRRWSAPKTPPWASIRDASRS